MTDMTTKPACSRRFWTLHRAHCPVRGQADFAVLLVEDGVLDAETALEMTAVDEPAEPGSPRLRPQADTSAQIAVADRNNFCID